MRLSLLFLLLGLCCGQVAHAGELTLRYRNLQATVWTPAGAAAGRLPVLVFSHGFHGCDVQARFLVQAFADAGYLVLAPNHSDAACHGGRSNWLEASQQPFWQPQLWSDATYADRAADIRALIDDVRADPRFAARADWSRLGLVGHSLGGYTALGLAGGWPRWKLPGVRAVLALAPYSIPFDAHAALPGLQVPVMYQCGGNDFAITPMVDGADGSYSHSPAPKYYVEFDGAGHLAWTDADRTAHALILRYALAFLNHYLKDQPADAVLTQALPGVSKLDFDSELGRSMAAPAAQR